MCARGKAYKKSTTKQSTIHHAKVSVATASTECSRLLDSVAGQLCEIRACVVRGTPQAKHLYEELLFDLEYTKALSESAETSVVMDSKCHRQNNYGRSILPLITGLQFPEKKGHSGQTRSWGNSFFFSRNTILSIWNLE